MPIYEYRCEQCGDFEVTQRITEDPLKKCPTCKRKVRKLISNTSFQLKGSGWYITDYGRGGADKGGAKDKEKGGESSASADSGASTESKSEKKAEGKGKGKKPSAKAA